MLRFLKPKISFGEKIIGNEYYIKNFINKKITAT